MFYQTCIKNKRSKLSLIYQLKQRRQRVRGHIYLKLVSSLLSDSPWVLKRNLCEDALDTVLLFTWVNNITENILLQTEVENGAMLPSCITMHVMVGSEMWSLYMNSVNQDRNNKLWCFLWSLSSDWVFLFFVSPQHIWDRSTCIQTKSSLKYICYTFKICGQHWFVVLI